MLQRLRNATCVIFGHDFMIESPDTLGTTVRCRRCNGEIRYRFEVEDGFFQHHWPERYGEDGNGVPAKVE